MRISQTGPSAWLAALSLGVGVGEIRVLTFAFGLLNIIHLAVHWHHVITTLY